MEKAYETTWPYGIIRDLHRIGLRGRLPVFVSEYLRTWKKQTDKELKKALARYIHGFVTEGLESGDSRPFWKYGKHQQQDSMGVPPLKKNGSLHSDSMTKASILLYEFKSVFTREDTSFIPNLPGNAFPGIGDLTVHKVESENSSRIWFRQRLWALMASLVVSPRTSLKN